MYSELIILGSGGPMLGGISKSQAYIANLTPFGARINLKGTPV